MKIQIQKPLFAWDCLEDHPALATIKQLTRRQFSSAICRPTTHFFGFFDHNRACAGITCDV